MAFHVDYWDGLGWRDRFALAASTERQRLYAKNMGSFSVYTPQLIVDGRHDFVGSDRVSGRGENAGRELEEFNIVRALTPLGEWAGAPQQFEALVGTIPADATDVAILIQPVGQGPIIGAVSTSLS